MLLTKFNEYFNIFWSPLLFYLNIYILMIHKFNYFYVLKYWLSIVSILTPITCHMRKHFNLLPQYFKHKKILQYFSEALLRQVQSDEFSIPDRKSVV